jgi:ATP-dependent protease HslVU (ClpYQ) peptidase subunit
VTTIAYRDGVLAGDTQVSSNDGHTVIGHQKKVHKLEDGSLFGFAGSVEQAEVLRRSFADNTAVDLLDDLNALIITPDHKVYLFEGRIWVKQPKGYCALGSGETVALAAMDAGADAITAVKIGIKRDTCTGGKVFSVKLKGKK